jgi:flavorubredoxin
MSTQTIYILYYSKSGNTKALAEKIYDKLLSTTQNNSNINIEIKELSKLLSIPNSEALDNLLKASAFIIGSPDYFEYPSGWIKVFFDEMYNHRNELRDIPVFGFISHGGGDEETVKKHLRNLFDWMGFLILGDIISVKNESSTKETEAKIQNLCNEMIKNLK